jgi:KAP family P-loop domain
MATADRATGATALPNNPRSILNSFQTAALCLQFMFMTHEMPTGMPSPELSADQPISSADQDVLGRGRFVQAIVNAISAWSGRESLVMALYGPWGSGKSSIKNMVLEMLRKSPTPTPVIEFNPWVWSGQDRLLSAFFEEVGASLQALGKTNVPQKVVRDWAKYAAMLSLGGTAIKHLGSVAKLVAPPGVGAGLDLVAKGAEATSRLLHEAEAADRQKAKAPPSLAELKRNLSESMQNSSGRSLSFSTISIACNLMKSGFSFNSLRSMPTFRIWFS